NDPYEKEADAMADKVVQRLSENKVQTKPDNNFFFNKNRKGLIQQKHAPVSSITPLVQTKCAACEREEKLQKKEKEDEKDLVNDKLQKKTIFESNAEAPDHKLNIRGKGAAGDHEDQNKLQTEYNNGSAQSEANGRA